MKFRYALLLLALPLARPTGSAAQPAARPPARPQVSAAASAAAPAAAATPQTPKELTGPAYAAVAKYYLAHDVPRFMAALPALEKAYPASPWTRYFQAFVKHMSRQDLPGALQGYSEVIRQLPDEFGDAYLHRAELLADKGLLDRAVADMDRAITLASPKVPASLYTLRGDFQAQGGHEPEAIADFKKSIALDGANAKSYRGLVNLSQKNGIAAETAALLTKALAGAQAQNAAVRLAYAALLTQTKQWAAAEAEYDRALATAGFQPTGQDLNNAAVAARNGQHFPKAEGLLERAIALDPRDVNFVVNRASLAVDQQQWEAVYKWAQAALAVSADSPMANMLMAVGLTRTNRDPAAARDYEAKAKRLDAANH